MPNIKLTDNFGLDVDVTTDILSSISKYFTGLTKISLAGFNLQSIASLSLDNPSVTGVHAGLKFDQPVKIGSGGVTLSLGAGASGSMDIYVPPSGGGSLFASDLYGESIAVEPAERYVSVALSATAGPEIAAAANQLSFAFQGGATVSLAHYRLFETRPTAPSVIEAVGGTLADFCIPGGPGDLAGLPAGSIVTLEGIGTVKLSGSANLLAVANPLATLALPSPLPALDVSAGGSVTIGASFQVTWDYQLRVRKLDEDRVTLGFYRKRGSETTVSVHAGEGVSAGITGTDLFSTVISAVSKSATVDAGALAGLGLPAAQTAAIQAAVKAAAERKLEIALLASLTAAESRDAAFLYEFDFSALDQPGRDALSAALRGDLSAVTGGGLPAGVRMLRSIATDLAQTGSTWKINLLGIYNYISTAELVRQGTVLFEPVTGDLVITDKATASRVAAATANFGADTAKLRSVLAESFLITAVYRGSQTIVAAPEIACSHSYFELHASTNREAMRRELTAAGALGLLDPGAQDAALGAADQFGRTMVYAETSYDGQLTSALFLNGADPKPPEEFESAGREAIGLLVRHGDGDDFRLLGVGDDALWAKMRDAGQPNFAPLFPGLTDLQVNVIAADYTAIVWWAGAMSSCAQRLAAMQELLAADPDPTAANFLALRADLAKHLAKVAAETREEFGQPWGLVAMDRVSGGLAAARVAIAGSRFALARSRVRTAAAGSVRLRSRAVL